MICWGVFLTYGDTFINLVFVGLLRLSYAPSHWLRPVAPCRNLCGNNLIEVHLCLAVVKLWKQLDLGL